jgi:methylated-DNA-protein-cysteine methyltransferase-like protein
MTENLSLPNPEKFYAEVWNIVTRIPRGKVASYGQIAKMIRPPEGVSAEMYVEYGALWVSKAVASSPNEVPWQRVVSSKGEINERDKMQAKRHQLLLEDEGVFFNARGRIDMKKFGWNGK